MLSLVGSIQRDPFSPAHKPYTSMPSADAREATPEPAVEEPEVADSDSDEDEDGFRHLKRKAAKSSVKEEVVEKPSKKKRKSKRDK